MKRCNLDRAKTLCRRGVLIVVVVLLATAVQAGPIFLPGALDDGKFVPNADVTGACYSIRYSTITATVDNGMAATKIQETIVGPDEAVRTVCLIPLPEGTDRQSLVVASGIPNGDHALLGGGKYLDAEAAGKTYEAIAKGLGSVKILALTGRPALLIPKFNLKGKVEIVVQLQQKVEKLSGVWSLKCPMPATQFADGPVARLAVAVNLGSRSGEPLRAIFSPTHNATVERDGLQDAVIRVKIDNWQGTDDFRLCWVADRDDLGLRVLAYRDENDPDGYFMLLGNPTGTDAKQQNLIDKDLIFVLDTSGSMRGEKIEQARAAIEYCLDRLNPGDRFNVVTFGTEVVSFRDAPVARTVETLAAAREFIEGVVAKGRTNIGGALAKALEGTPEKDRPRITIFLTDGTPTAGELVPEKIVESVKAVQPPPTRFFVMGVGHDVNAHLLDKLAEATDGSSEYVEPDEEIDARVATLYDRLSHPVLTGVAIDFGELRPHSVYPEKLPALFTGSEVMVFGRYRQRGAHTFRVRGTLAGKPVAYTCRAELPGEPNGPSNAFVAPLWAARKIGYLLQELRLHGENEELIAEVVRLSKKFGIVTEYTEFLAMLDVDVSTAVANGEAQRLMQYANRLQAGQWAVNQAFNDKELQNRMVATQGGNNYRDRRGNVVVNGNVRQFADQVFYLRDGQWVDAEEQGDRKTRVVKLFSPEYMQLLRNNKDFARAQELGWAVSANIGNERIVIENEGVQRMEELRRPQELRLPGVNRLQQIGPNQLQNFNDVQQFRNQQMNQRQEQQQDINRKILEQLRNEAGNVENERENR